MGLPPPETTIKCFSLTEIFTLLLQGQLARLPTIRGMDSDPKYLLSETHRASITISKLRYNPKCRSSLCRWTSEDPTQNVKSLSLNQRGSNPKCRSSLSLNQREYIPKCRSSLCRWTSEDPTQNVKSLSINQQGSNPKISPSRYIEYLQLNQWGYKLK